MRYASCVERDDAARAFDLARSHGFSVRAEDGVVGEVETPLFPPDGDEADYLVVRVTDDATVRLPIVPAGLVVAVDATRRVVCVAGRRADITGRPERLPFAR